MSFLQTNFGDQDVEEVEEALFDVYPNDIIPPFPSLFQSRHFVTGCILFSPSIMQETYNAFEQTYMNVKYSRTLKQNHLRFSFYFGLSKSLILNNLIKAIA